MKVEVNVSKRYFFVILGAVLILAGVIGAIAIAVTPGAVPNPGHALSTIQGYFAGDPSLETSLGKFCQTDGSNCQLGGGNNPAFQGNGSFVGGGTSSTIYTTGAMQSCGAWGSATCSSGKIVTCPSGSSRRQTGKDTIKAQSADQDTNYAYWYICVKD